MPPGTTVLDAAKWLGIRIPTMCHVPGIEPAGVLLRVRRADRRTPHAFARVRYARGGGHGGRDQQRRRARRAQDGAGTAAFRSCRRVRGALRRAVSGGPGYSGLRIRHRRRGQSARHGGDRRTSWPCRDLSGGSARACASSNAAVARWIRVWRSARCTASSATDVGGPPAYLPSREPSQRQESRRHHRARGPAGLAAAYYLLRSGHDCTLFDAHPLPAGCCVTASPPTGCPRTRSMRRSTSSGNWAREFRMNSRWGERLHAGRIAPRVTTPSL